MPEQLQEYRSCAVYPLLPDPDDEQGTAVFLRELDAAYFDCRNTLMELNQWLDEARTRAKK